eukprot:CAMPEP_0167788084 /NCGR_PEP_ID=MMETSP0111_2-20121227/9823_1 /TAXON_ID=91324 /ORGANISM="Lotharella globosa, Strain CCCM811" /LENGTH=59 /DNA_ID=CAMNT_0007679881 /DNA_START=69 /DNA_END=248 /DNA_ORIENTATION=+
MNDKAMRPPLSTLCRIYYLSLVMLAIISCTEDRYNNDTTNDKDGDEDNDTYRAGHACLA